MQKQAILWQGALTGSNYLFCLSEITVVEVRVKLEAPVYDRGLQMKTRGLSSYCLHTWSLADISISRHIVDCSIAQPTVIHCTVVWYIVKQKYLLPCKVSSVLFIPSPCAKPTAESRLLNIRESRTHPIMSFYARKLRSTSPKMLNFFFKPIWKC